MSRHPLRVPVKVPADKQPLIDALQDLSVDIGSVAMARVLANAPPDIAAEIADADPEGRVLCIAAADMDAMVAIMVRLARDAEGRADRARSGRVLFVNGPHDTALAVFLDVRLIPM